MARYVNADDLLVKMMDLNLDHVQGDDDRELCQVIQALPTADVREVKRGKWLEKQVFEGNSIEEWQSAKCSACGRYHTTPYLYYFRKANYCPFCGADMRGGK